MYSFHLVNSPWFLLLIPAGLFILWRQYSGPGGPARSGGALFALQAAALILLCVSLAGPELRRHHATFHNPAVLILRDRSGSFAAGATLGLGRAYADFRRGLEAAYAARKFDVKVVDFADDAWPVAGFKDMNPREDTGPDALTSLAAAADFADSAGIPNLQAVFLFSDGRANLDSGRASRTWRVPVHPVVFAVDSFSEAQPLRAQADGQGIELAWESVGRPAAGPSFKLIQGQRTLLTRTLPLPETPGIQDPVRIAWKPDGGSREPLLAVLQPGGKSADPVRWNDTLAVRAPAAGMRRVLILRPVRGLDEKAMIGALQSGPGTAVAFFSADEAQALALGPDDQIWAEAGAWSAQPRLAAWMKSIPAKVVLYARAGQDGMAYGDRPSGAAPRLPGLADAWPAFPPSAEVKAARTAADAFPAEVVRLKGITALALLAPPVPQGRSAWVEVRDGARRGLLMGSLELGQGKRAFFFCLPAIWGTLFDPQGDFAMRENAAAYVRSARDLAELDDGRARALLPRRATAGIPFEAAPRMPETSAAEAAFGIAGAGYSREWPRPAEGDWKIKDVVLPVGRFRAWIRAGADTLWKDSLEAAAPEALEMARLGFDEAALREIASLSGGTVLHPSPVGDVASLLPNLPAAQIRVDRADSIRLHNTLSLCLLILLLLSLSWYLRKKWDLD